MFFSQFYKCTIYFDFFLCMLFSTINMFFLFVDFQLITLCFLCQIKINSNNHKSIIRKNTKKSKIINLESTNKKYIF